MLFAPPGLSGVRAVHRTATRAAVAASVLIILRERLGAGALAAVAGAPARLLTRQPGGVALLPAAPLPSIVRSLRGLAPDPRLALRAGGRGVRVFAWRAPALIRRTDSRPL